MAVEDQSYIIKFLQRKYLWTLMEIQYVNQQMHSVKCNKIQTITHNSHNMYKPYMFRHRTAILREFTSTKEHKSKDANPEILRPA